MDCDSAPFVLKRLPVLRNVTSGFVNALLTDDEVRAFDAAHRITPEEVDELVELFDDEFSPEPKGELTAAQLTLAFRKYRHYDPGNNTGFVVSAF